MNLVAKEKKKAVHHPATIDDLIVAEVDRLTSEDSSIWTCPDHNRREYVHSFFQYPAMMIPVVQKKLIETICRSHGNVQNMLDPYMGSATTIVACMENGLNCYGQDINPLAILIANVRTGPFYVESIRDKSEILLRRVKADLSRKIEAHFENIDFWFKSKIKIELSRIVRAIRKEKRLAVRRFFWVILAETVRLSSNDRTSTFKLHRRPIKEIENRDFSATDVFEFHLEQSIEDYRLHADLLKKSEQLSNGAYKHDIEIRLLDSKESVYVPGGAPFYDLLVTSPPYGDNKTTVPYGQHSYLPLQWIDLDDIDSRANKLFLRTASEIDRRSLGGKIGAIKPESREALDKISPTLKRIHSRLLKDSPHKVKKVTAFFTNLNDSISTIMSALRPNSYLVWTIGNRRVNDLEIRNNQILIELLTHHGCMLIKQVEREILNKRMARRNNETALMNTEDILIFRKVG